MFKDILVPVLGIEIPEAAIAVACGIAGTTRAHVEALVGASLVLPNAGVWAYYPEGFHATMKEAAEATVAAAADAVAPRLEDAAARSGVASTGVRRCTTIWLTTAEMAAMGARYADLTVLGRGKDPDEQEWRLFGALLAGSGRPLLVVPRDAGAPTGHAVVAWKSTREAARALHDALPMLRMSSSVEVLMVDAEDDAAGSGAEDDLLLAHLARHGIEARLAMSEPAGESTGTRILEHAARFGTSLVVAGGYGHSRAREQVFGGVTRALFEHASCAVLFSH
jgi:nucleotide-binding universal stress UspA family protein